MNLASLPVQRGFRLRGGQATRLETFVDAAFAFAVSLLVVSFGQLPESFSEIHDALRRLPAFVAGFAVLALFWYQHYRFSRRYGLESTAVVWISLALVATTLFYVFPLRMVMSAGMHFLTGGWSPSELRVRNFDEFRAIFVIYGAGFMVLAGLIALLYRQALRRADALQLDPAERLLTHTSIGSQLILAAVAALSVAIALLMPPSNGWPQALPGMTYALLGIAMPWYETWMERRIAPHLEARAQSA